MWHKFYQMSSPTFNEEPNMLKKINIAVSFRAESRRCRCVALRFRVENNSPCFSGAVIFAMIE